jgi:hypothetical protein
VVEATVSVALPLLLVPRPTPVGGVPVKLIVASGEPEVVTANVPPVPVTKPAHVALEKVGAVPTVSVNDWVTVPPTPFVALKVNG